MTTVLPAETYDAGTYEVLRDRLTARAAELARRAEALNARRAEEFGATRLDLTGTAQVRTERPCVPRDVVAVGELLLLGFHSARSDRQVADVLTLYDRDLNAVPENAVPGLLDDTGFQREFAQLHRYYRQTRLLGLRRADDRLLAVFQTGDKSDDTRVLRWTLTADGRAAFLDARGERDHVPPPSHDFDWTETTRADHVAGERPSILVRGEILISTVGGRLTVGGTDDEDHYSEPVREPLQSLADADVAHARVGALTLLRIRPYNEDAHRYLVFNTLTRSVVRLDGIGQACRRLPEDQGVVFPGGYCLGMGTHRTFDVDATGLEFEREVRSPYGEDVLYAFHDRAEGRTLLLSYNTIRKEIAAPLVCRGWAAFDDGLLMVLRAEGDEPARVHPVQLWASPFVSDTHAAALAGEGPLARVGNADLVRGIADCLSVARTVAETAATTEMYEALATACVRVADTHHWLDDPGLGGLRAPLDEVRDTAEQVLGEFRTVRALTRQAAVALDEAADRVATAVRRLRGESPRSAAAWVSGLTELRRSQGHLLALKETRYADTDRIDALAAEADQDLAAFGQRAVAFLAREDAFAEQSGDVERLAAEAESIATVAEAEPVAARIEAAGKALRTVTEVVAGLDIADTVVRTSVLERLADVLGSVNRARALLDARRRTLREGEGRSEFAAELALLGQAVTGALASADSPAACDEQLSGLLVRLENLEARFSEFDDVLAVLADRRTEVYEAFGARKQALLDARAGRAERLAASADRVLRTIGRRAASLTDTDAVSSYFASDPLVVKVRRTADELRALGDPVRAEELDGRVRACRQEASRALRDRGDLYSDGGRTLRLGAHRFAVATQPLDLTLVPHGDGLAFALTGTDYRSPVTDPEIAADRPYWNRPLPSESPEVYRAEYLAARLLREHGPATLATADVATLVRDAAQEAYDEGYERGVHDHDAIVILSALLPLFERAGALRYEPAARAAAQLFWAHGASDEARTAWRRRAASLARARDTYGPTRAIADLERELAEAIAGSIPHEADPGAAAAYLFEELTAGVEGFVISAGIGDLLEKFRRTAGHAAYTEDLTALDDLAARRQLAAAWLSAFASATGTELTAADLGEAVAAEVCPHLDRYDGGTPPTALAEGLLGAHPRITDGTLTVRVDDFLARTTRFADHEVPALRAHQRRRTALLDRERSRLRLDDHRPRPLAAFVRGRLIDEVHLPLIGDSLARQLGTVGDSKRTDTGGLLLLVSPPGYGKTTLVEYVADRLGLMLVKVSGPALGHDVTSLDPDEAPNTTARQEIEKINFALAVGNNTLLHLDDIQHTSPELLQRFIPLCDSTRRVEGVWDGQPRTYDLRGKRFAVCMTGNPYTESGALFHVPDMLANRADVWNLGDVLTGKEDAFALSFLENALTSHPVLAPLAGRDRADLDQFVRLAENDPTARADRLTHPYTAAEVEQIVAVLRHLLAARETVLAVNAAYIASAGQSDATRAEPPFRLQGSYRTMNKITARIRPAMNRAELAAVIDDHFAAEAQTLTGGAEANLLKLAELRGTLTPERRRRWSELKAAHVRTRAHGDPEEGPLARAVAVLGLLAERMAAVEAAISRVRIVDPDRQLTDSDRSVGP
ncbi:DNA repair ATPase [Streptomyces sp. NPDC058867]|uniref:DNA repair ATPase n=1 Tax=unclassified Streptomyces TaxID=2593676 RepID=UPI00367FDE66